jgi:hypothetical protein
VIRREPYGAIARAAACIAVAACGDVYELGRLPVLDASVYDIVSLDEAEVDGFAKVDAEAGSGDLLPCDPADGQGCAVSPNNPCAGKSCGAPCVACPPRDPRCADAALMQCDDHETCGGATSSMCVGAQSIDSGGPPD